MTDLEDELAFVKLARTGPDYRDQGPEEGETAESYAGRLERIGYEEMYICKGLGFHFEMQIGELSDFMEKFPKARLRHSIWVLHLFPNMTEA